MTARAGRSQGTASWSNVDFLDPTQLMRSVHADRHAQALNVLSKRTRARFAFNDIPSLFGQIEFAAGSCQELHNTRDRPLGVARTPRGNYPDGTERNAISFGTSLAHTIDNRLDDKSGVITGRLSRR